MYHLFQCCMTVLLEFNSMLDFFSLLDLQLIITLLQKCCHQCVSIVAVECHSSVSATCSMAVHIHWDSKLLCNKYCPHLMNDNVHFYPHSAMLVHCLSLWWSACNKLVFTEKTELTIMQTPLTLVFWHQMSWWNSSGVKIIWSKLNTGTMCSMPAAGIKDNCQLIWLVWMF